MNVQKSYEKWMATDTFSEKEDLFACANNNTNASFYYGGFQGGKKSAKKRIKELEKALEGMLDEAERERVSGDCGNWEWDEDHEYTKAMKILQKGKRNE